MFEMYSNLSKAGARQGVGMPSTKLVVRFGLTRDKRTTWDPSGFWLGSCEKQLRSDRRSLIGLICSNLVPHPCIVQAIEGDWPVKKKTLELERELGRQQDTDKVKKKMAK